MADNIPLVITLWETYGSNMEAVAEKLAAELGVPLHKQAYSSEAIEAASEKREKEGALGVLLRNMSSAYVMPDGRPSSTGAAIEHSYVQLAEENKGIVLAEAAQGGVLQGRNGQFLLRDRPNTLHVKLDGPVEARVAHAASASGISLERARKRQKLEDQFRAEMSEKTYHFDPRDNSHYDVVVNGAGLPVDGVVAIIKAALKAKLG